VENEQAEQYFPGIFNCPDAISNKSSNRSGDVHVKTNTGLLPSVFALSLVLLAMVPWAEAGCSVSGGCGSRGDYWTATAQSFIDSDVPLVGVTAGANTEVSTAFTSSFKAGQAAIDSANKTSEGTVPKLEGVYVTPGSRADQFTNSDLLKPLDAVSPDELVLDVSNRRSSGEAHIRGAIHIPSKSFFYENGTLRSASELSELLGNAGISREDAVMVYSDTFSSGEATSVLWALEALGQKSARALDGGLDNWIGDSLPMQTSENIRPSVSYSAIPINETIVDYDYVKSGQAQLVDARSLQDYGTGKIGNATFVSPERLIEGGRLSPGKDLSGAFAVLDMNRTVVVYSDDINKASLVWFALQLQGFDSRIYSWQDWQEHEHR